MSVYTELAVQVYNGIVSAPVMRFMPCNRGFVVYISIIEKCRSPTTEKLVSITQIIFSEVTIMSNKIISYKTEDGKNQLVLSSVYENNCSQEETVVVDDNILEVLEESRRAEERNRTWERRHRNKGVYLGNESFEAKLGLVTQSPDETVHSEMYMDYLRQFFDEKVYRRGIMYYLDRFTECEIAEIEGVSQAAVSKSIKTFKEIMGRVYGIEISGK